MADEQDHSLPRRRSTRRHIPNVNRHEALTLAEAAQRRAELASGVCEYVSSDFILINSTKPAFSFPHLNPHTLQISLL